MRMSVPDSSRCVAKELPQAMDMGLFLDAAGVERQAEGELEGGATHRSGGGGGALTAVTLGGEDQPIMPMGFPALTEQDQSALG